LLRLKIEEHTTGLFKISYLYRYTFFNSTTTF
jgi:hypothetical protein